jgi:signal transduction histidine kinase/ligand-binding sensor domain-containing protein
MQFQRPAIALLRRALLCYYVWLWGWWVEGAAANAPWKSLESVAADYIVDAWQTEQGLPDNFINAIAQSPEGYLWIATFNGLARFNGMEFVVFTAANTPELPSSRIIGLHLDKRGRLWIRSEYGDLSEWSEGCFRAFGEPKGLPKECATVLCEDYEGEIWAGSSWDVTNYYHLRDGAFERVSTTNTLTERLGHTPDIHGYGWSIRSNRLFSVQPKQCVDVVVPGFHPPQGWRLAASRDGGMWMIADRIRKYRENTWEDFGPLPVATDQFGECLEDRSRNLWVGIGAGELWRIGTNHVFRRFKLPEGTNMELGHSIFEDAEGNLWIGNGGEGLVRLKPRAVRTYDSRDGLASDVVRSVTQDRAGNVWLATVNNVDWFPPGSSGHAENRRTGIMLPWTIYGGHDGAIWVGTYAEGLWCGSGQIGTWFRESGRPKSMGPVMNAIFEDRDGQIHLGTPQGIYSIENGCLSRGKIPGVPEMDVRAFAENSSGELYVGLNGGGLLRHSKDRWEQFTRRDGLADDHIWSLFTDADDQIWIGTCGRGLSLFKSGKFHNFSTTTGGSVLEPELPNVINTILEDDLGQLWLGSNQGLYRVNRRQLSDLAAGRGNFADVTRYDRADGMGSSQCTGDTQPTSCKTRDGKLWFATMKGVTVVDPHMLPFNSRPPPVVIESVLVDDKPRPVVGGTPAGEPLSVAAGVHRLEFHYAGLSFTAPDKVRFRYRLEGFDNNWNNVGSRRVAYYTKVPPGSYRFKVLACNNDNVWNETGASLALLIVPLFWQRTWFQTLSVLAAATALLGVFKLRVVQIERRRLLQETFSRRLLESQENERKRIASELHDSLGQSLLVMKNYAVMALRDTATIEKMREQLGEISAAASSSIEEVRTIARALRPYQLDRFGLTKTLEDAAELLAKSGSLKIETQIENVDGIFSAEAEISLYRVIQEWLSNVAKHARASTARVGVRKESGLVRLLLEDDGIGFDATAVMNRSGRETGFGLVNLRERVRLLGGVLKIDSAPGGGTRMTVDIPYEEPNHSSNS